VKRFTPIFLLCAVLALAIAGCGDSDDSSSESTGSTSTESTEASTTAKKTKPTITAPKGAPPKELEINDLEEGSGATAKSGDEVTVQYVGVNYKSGKEFDSSWSRNEPFTFGLGAGQLIPAWEQGIEGMKVGGRRELTVPPDLAYGKSGYPPSIPPEETLIFVIDLLSVK
jgi:peptidylprolyl isomerase